MKPAQIIHLLDQGARLSRKDWNTEEQPHYVFAVKGKHAGGITTIMMCSIVGKTTNPLRELPMSELFYDGWEIVPKEAHADLVG